MANRFLYLIKNLTEVQSAQNVDFYHISFNYYAVNVAQIKIFILGSCATLNKN